MFSIIMPAHNEAAVIGRSIGALLESALPGELEIIVVCNGCKDNTAEVASQFGPPVHVIDTDVPSKSNALNLGDQAARGFPRFYLDSDVMVTLDSVRRIAKVLEQGPFLAAAPKVHFKTEQSSWFVQAYYRIWLKLNAVRQGISGSGMYAMSRAGRERFGAFPQIIADDGFAQLMFKPEERTVVADCQSNVTAPRSLHQLIQIKTRACFGDLELAYAFPDLRSNKEEPSDGTSFVELAKKASLWPALIVYAYVRLVSKLRGRWRWKYGDHAKWDRDESSREPLPTS